MEEIADTKDVQHVSWVHHPIHGVHSIKGAEKHSLLYHQKPELEDDTNGNYSHTFKTPRGSATIYHKTKTVNVRHYPIKTPPHDSSQTEVETHLRKSGKIPKGYTVKHFDGRP